MKVGFSGFHCISETLTIVRVHLKKQLNSFALKKKKTFNFSIIYLTTIKCVLIFKISSWLSSNTYIYQNWLIALHILFYRVQCFSFFKTCTGKIASVKMANAWLVFDGFFWATFYYTGINSSICTNDIHSYDRDRELYYVCSIISRVSILNWIWLLYVFY